MHRSASRLLPILIGMALLAPVAASAQAPGISHAEAVQALRAAQGLFTEQLASGGGAVSRDATVVLRDLAVALPELRGEDRREGNRILARPTDKGRDYFGREADASPICNANFCVHWTDTKKNAPDSPEFVNEVVASLDQSFAVENGTLGWQPAKSDGGRGARSGVGGEGQVDVYIANLGRSLYGYAAPDPGQKKSRRFAYLVLDNDYEGFPSSPLDSLRVTVAHEYNHILQFNYDTLQDAWMFEATATWVEEQVYPEINDYLNYLSAFAKGSATPMTGRGIKIYSEAVWNHWLSFRYGLPVVRDAWAASQGGVKPAHLATAAYTEAIAAYGGDSFAPEFGTFAAATAEWKTGTTFPDAAVYPDMKRKGTLGKNTRKVVLDNTSYELLDVKPSGGPSETLKVRGPAGIESTIALVGREGPVEGGLVTTAIKHLANGGSGSVTLPDPGRFSRITAVVVNSDGSVKRGRDYRGDGSVFRFGLK